jgi:hypothetical protein
MKRLLPVLLAILLTSTATLAQESPFSLKDGLIRLDTAGYAVTFRESDGSIAYIHDKRADGIISQGQSDLWSATLDNDDAVEAGAFRYEIGDSLLLHYGDDVTITVSPLDDAAFTMQARVSNPNERAIDLFRFPDNLFFPSASQDALLPMMPGALLNAEFFASDTTYVNQYPGVMFADYLALRAAEGKLALYSQRGELVQPVYLGFDNASDFNATIVHNYKTWIAGGETWTSPVLVVRVGQDYPETIAAFRAENGIDGYKSLDEKLGDDAPQYFAAPMYKLDLNVLKLTFDELQSVVIERLNVPGIVHFVTFQVGGHDNNYPDFIPPDPKWGTTEEFAALVAQVHERGGLAIPYTNFSWWDNNSSVLAHLPADVTLPSVIVTDSHGLPAFESYGPRSGFVVDLNNAFVQGKIAEQHDLLLNTVGMDGIFEDQFGARNAPYDFNPAALEHYDPATGYYAGVLGHMRAHAPSNLMMEVGIDVLADDAIGFWGSNYLWDVLGFRSTAAYTSYYPMAGMLLRDKVLFYQHNLASQTWTKDKDMLRWNLAQGYGLSSAFFDETIPALNMDNPWLNLIGVFQKYALAHYADELVQSYEDLGEGVTRTSFASYTIDANWNAEQPYTIDAYTLPPGGVVTRANDGTVVAGVFSAYNDQPLSEGDHYLIEVVHLDEILVFQPVGADTPLSIALPDWESFTVEAYHYDSSLIAPVEATDDGDYARFTYTGSVGGEQVGYYRIAPITTP